MPLLHQRAAVHKIYRPDYRKHWASCQEHRRYGRAEPSPCKRSYGCLKHWRGRWQHLVVKDGSLTNGKLMHLNWRLTGGYCASRGQPRDLTMQRPGECQEETVIQGCIEGSRPRGRPARIWINDILEATNCTLRQLLLLTEDCQSWREMIPSASNHQYWWRTKKKKRRF